MYGKERTHEPSPATRSQHFPEYREAAQQKTFYIVVNQSSIYSHTLRFNTAWTTVRLRIAYMRREGILEALKFRKQRGHGSHRHAESESGQCARLHASVH